MRFNALLRGVEGISQKVLAANLRELERDGYNKRAVMNASLPCVEYALTEMGEDVLRMLATVATWVEGNWQAMENKRREYDCKIGRIDASLGQRSQFLSKQDS